MSRLYDRYLEGFYQEVYDELLAKQEQVVEGHNYEDALLVAREIMKRVRYNVGLLIPRLRDLEYQFGKGFFEDLSPDNYFKYGYGGTGAYSIILPCKAFDAPLLLERHHTTFINYLRLCFRWGGFPGLELDNQLKPSELASLIKDLQP